MCMAIRIIQIRLVKRYSALQMSAPNIAQFGLFHPGYREGGGNHFDCEPHNWILVQL